MAAKTASKAAVNLLSRFAEEETEAPVGVEGQEQADTGWSVPAVTGAFSAGLVVSALVGVPVGRGLDRIGPRLLMTAGSVVAVPAVAVIALAGSYPVFVTGWLLAGVAMAGTLYPPAFAALTRWWGPQRVTALTGLTLLAGLASTVFAPVTAALLPVLGGVTPTSC